MHEITLVKDLGVLMATSKYDKCKRTKESKKKHKRLGHTNVQWVQDLTCFNTVPS